MSEFDSDTKSIVSVSKGQTLYLDTIQTTLVVPYSSTSHQKAAREYSFCLIACTTFLHIQALLVTQGEVLNVS